MGVWISTTFQQGSDRILCKGQRPFPYVKGPFPARAGRFRANQTPRRRIDQAAWKNGSDFGLSTVLEPQLCSREVKRNGSRLIRKVYETDPLVCPRCWNRMRVIASMEGPKIIRRILEHLGLWLANVRPVPKAHSPPGESVPLEAFISQLPALEEDDFSQLPPARWECRTSPRVSSIFPAPHPSTLIPR
jgi:hypothetical protein